MGNARLTPSDFEIYLLGTMACDPSMTRQALRKLGRSRKEMEQITQRMSEATKLGSDQFSKLRTVLGVVARFEEVVVDGNPSTIASVVFALWPEFSFQVTERNGFWVDARFVRIPGTESPAAAHPSDLTPWKFTIDEVEERFGPLAVGDSWLPYQDCGLTHISPVDGARTEFELVFSWNLLQRIKVASP